MTNGRCALAAIVVLASALGACRDSGADGELVRLDGKIFVFNYRVATARYLVNLLAVRSLEPGNTAVVSFEDPAGGAPIVVRETIWPQVPKTTVTSPPLRCVVKDHPYAVSIAIEGADGATRQTIQTTIVSSEDQTILPDRALVVGPLYTPNPQLADHPGGKLPNDPNPPCPAPKV